ncbi:class IIb bacteriocin, lactobin A/cerein 7B family, partial [Aquimarina sp. U1-2]|uniref:class IIb bacteriocin, lactobin A/cerein 7B family n=2 Tax=Aquimarina sp. U1-2 TaxID=2823141 RepID=UPI001AECED37
NSLLNINIMKSQNVNNKLRFDKNALVELNDEQLTEVNGGTTPVCVGVIIGITASIVIDNLMD